jgi:peptidoglycan/xylan/chitin deacetylase (PgdA/CDA1 family)
MTSGTGRLCIFWDYDTQWGADRSRGRGGDMSYRNLEFDNTDRLLEIHAKYAIPGCFGVVGAAALPGETPYHHNPAQIRRIHESGHEVASHTMFHEWLPGLTEDALKTTLRGSKDALEQCIAAPVISFVPPYTQPFDFPARWAFSVSERREAKRHRNDIPAMCRALGETGYRFARIQYRTLRERIARVLGRVPAHRPQRLEEVEGITCLPLSGLAGFGPSSCSLLRRCAAEGGYAVVYGHPHSLYADNPQNERYLIEFLEQAAALRAQAALTVVLPRDLVDGK